MLRWWMECSMTGELAMEREHGGDPKQLRAGDRQHQLKAGGKHQLSRAILVVSAADRAPPLQILSPEETKSNF